MMSTDERIQRLQDEHHLLVVTIRTTTDTRRKHDLSLQRDRLAAAIERLQVTVIAADDDTQADND